MLNPQKLESFYEAFMSDINHHLQDGITQVDLSLLKNQGLLNQTDQEENEIREQFPFYFHVIENQEKVTLFNNQFVVWIVPKVIDEVPTTLTIITLVKQDKPQIEIVFSTVGIYNTPKYVLKVLRHYLTEVIDTEEELASISKM